MQNRITFLSILFSLIISATFAQVEPVDKKGLAIGGYDVVAYFSNQPIKGQPSFTATYHSATYQFSSKDNLETFKKNPSQYIPQFDGYCAWGVGAKSAKFPINPETFKIIDNKLYLFFNGPLNLSTFNSIEEWNKDEKNLLKAANTNWPALKK
jgi:Uncharacterized conserved protein